jgi:thimet oligopeptidase
MGAQKSKSNFKTISSIIGLILISAITTCCIFKTASIDTNKAKDKFGPLNKTTLAKSIIRHDYSKGEITNICESTLNDIRQKLPAYKDAFQIETALTDLSDKLSPVTFMGYVHEDEAVRAEASACEEKYSQFYVEIFTNRKLYDVVKNTDVRTIKETRLVTIFKRGFEENGMKLSEQDLAEFKVTKTELAKLEAEFSKNLNEDQSFITLTEAELEGTTADFQGRLKKNKDGLYTVTTKSTDYSQIMDNSPLPTVRQKMLFAYDNRAADKNTPLLSKAIELRKKLAKLTGYKTWADYRTENRMAKNAQAPLDLLNDLKLKLKPRLQKDLDLQLQAKRKMEDPTATELKAWDVRYFANQVKKTNYNLDEEVVREYFPKSIVIKGMFEVYQTLFQVQFEEVKDANVWYKDVQQFAVRDNKSQDIIAYFFTDLHPRPGKYGHAAAFSLLAGRDLSEGTYSIPVASIVSNFNPATDSKPSLLSFSEVETLFHEFGHIMHQILTRGNYGYLSGTSVAQDFVEAPSQMLENWVWNAEILNKISGHYSDTSRKLPKELVEKMIAAKDFNQGYNYSRQLVLGLADLELHTNSQPLDIHETYKQVQTEILGFAPIEGSRWMASFGHMMGGYDAGYYGYLWSEVFAADMFTAFEKNGLLDISTGLSYRANILESGNMRDPLELLKDFLGREPNNKAFLKQLGL